MYLEVNDVHPTASNRLGAVMSSSYSASSKDHTQIIPYLLGIYEAYKLLSLEIDHSPINGENIKYALKKAKVKPTKLDLLTALLLTKEFSGFPIIPLTEYLYRGHNDPVTSGLE